MLEIALEFLRHQLNDFVAARTGSVSVEVKLARVVDDAGKYAIPPDSLGISLINVEEERTLREQLPTHTYVDGRHLVQEPPLKLNLHVIVAANFQHYDEALKHLSSVLTYFQSHPGFTPARHPSLDPRIEKLTVELQTLGYEQLNQVWAFIGGKQLPSAIYKVRMVILQDLEPTAVQPPVRAIGAALSTR
ncbi:MAG: DUF4255 domain-containing protein [Gemmatimonadetes bacterium]|nr:DUF4255 domain-containing protein [Gemmatimonadota bacterium]